MAAIPTTHLRVTVAKNTIPGVRIIPWWDAEFNTLPETHKWHPHESTFAIRNESSRVLTGMLVDWAATSDPEDCIGVWRDPFDRGHIGVPPGGSALTWPAALEMGNGCMSTTPPETQDLTLTINYALFDDGSVYGLDEASFDEVLRLARYRHSFILQAAAAPDLAAFMALAHTIPCERGEQAEQHLALRDCYSMAKIEEDLADAEFIRRALAETELYANMRFTLVD